MDPGNDDRRRLSPEEADARAAALIAQYRDGKKAPRSTRMPTFPPIVGLAFVYLCGVTGGAFWHVKPLKAVLVGLPLLVLVHTLVNRRRPGSK